MTDLFDQEIAESLHRSAAQATVQRGSFNDVRRRVRIRRQRHVAAAVLPAVAGMAWLGMRPTTSPSGTAAVPNATDSVPVSSETTADTTVTPPTEATEVTPTTSVGVSHTIPADLVAHVLCVDATGQAAGSTPGCTEYLPNAAHVVAPPVVSVYNGTAYVAPTAAAYKSEAETLAAFLGLAVWPGPDMISYLNDQFASIDTSNAHVFLVITGTEATTTCTVPACTPPTTVDLPVVTAAPGLQLDAKIATWLDRAGPALAALGFPTLEHKTDQDGVTKISASDPARPSERNITITIRPGVAEVTPTTYSTSDAEGGAAVKFQANDGWIYEIGVVDTGAGSLPTGDALLQIAFALGK